MIKDNIGLCLPQIVLILRNNNIVFCVTLHTVKHFSTTGLDKQKFSAKNCKYFLSPNEVGGI